jgi:hypothetical protein
VIRGSKVFLTLGFVVLAGSPLPAQPRMPRAGSAQSATQFGWLSTLEEGKAQARRTGMPLMVVFRCVP